MSKSISVVIEHKLGTDAAKERIAAAVPKFAETFGRTATLEQADLAGDTITFSIRAMGVRATGTVAIAEENVRIEADLPMVLIPFSGTVERLIAEHGGQLLRPILDRRDVTKKAKQTAQAEGLSWRELPREEKRQLKEQARLALLTAAEANQSPS